MELAKKIANEAGISKKNAERVIDVFTDTVIHCLNKRDKFTLIGFGTFSAVNKKTTSDTHSKRTHGVRIKYRIIPKFVVGGGVKARSK